MSVVPFLYSAAYSPVSILQTVQQFSVLVLCLTYATECKPDYSKADQIPAASNITLILLKWYPPAVRVCWSLNQTNIANVKEMQIFYNPVNSSVRSMIKVKPEIRQYTLNKLQPNQEYELKLLTISTDSMLTNSSDIVKFISPSNESSLIAKNQFAYYTPYSQEEIRRKQRLTMDEIVILLLVLVVWLTVICVFCSKWSKLRHLEPYHPDYRPSLGSTTQHSPAYSVDSDNLANVGALTTTPVASGGGLGEMTDEDDDGLLIGNVNTSGLPIQPISIPCSGMHPNQSIFAHTSCAHGLDVNLPVCTTAVGLSGVLITDPSMVAVSSATIGQSNFNQLFNQQSDDLNDINDINIPIPNTSQLQQQQTINANNYTSTVTTTTATNNKITGSHVEQVKKVQFQSVHHPPNAPYIAQFTNQELLQRATSPATFVLPVSMANPHLGDIYCHGTAIAYSTNFSSIDSNTSCNSTSCASCQVHNSNMNPNYCPSLTESLEHGQIQFQSNVNTELSSTGSSSLKQQQSVESIYIELPQRYHTRSNSTPSEDTNLNTVIYNATPSISSVTKHSPLTEEEQFNVGEEDDEESNQKDSSEEKTDLEDQQIVTNLKNKRVQKSKSEEKRDSEREIEERKTRSLDLDELKNEKIRLNNEIEKNKIVEQSKIRDQQLNLKKSSKNYFKHHSVDNISSRDTLPHHSLIRFHSITGLKKQTYSCSSIKSNLNQMKLELKAKNPKELDLLRKEHYRSDNMIMKNKKIKLSELNQFSDELTSSLKQRNNFKTFKALHSRSLTESTTSSLFVQSSSNESEIVNKLKKENLVQNKLDQWIDSTTSGSLQIQEEDEQTNSLQSLKDKENINYAKQEHDSKIDRKTDTKNTVQSSDSFDYYERTDDEELVLEEDKDVNRLIRSSTLEPIDKANINNRFIKMYQSATMYNIPYYDSNTDETRIGLEDCLLKDHNQIRKHQSTEQMLKKLIENLNNIFRRSFKL